MKGSFLLLAWMGGVVLAAGPVRADDSPVPGAGFSASRYEVLWKKSPFSVATDEAVPESPDYILAGIAESNGISYASLIDRKNQDHFLISSDKTTNGFTLTSITRGHEGSDTLAVVQKDGQSMTLKLEQLPVAAEGVPGTPPVMVPMPGIITPQIPMPGTGLQGSGRQMLPRARFHRPPINLPPPPVEQSQPRTLPSVPPK